MNLGESSQTSTGSWAYPSGTRVNYSYDAQGYLSGISVNPVNANGVGVSGSTTTLLNALSYNAENKITGWLWVDGKARTIAYDSNGMIAAYNLGDALGTGSTAGTLRTVSRDAAGRITGYSHMNNGTAQTSLDQGFGYDNLNRLLSSSLNGASTQYSYDETGNRTSKTIAGTTYTNTVATTSNRLTQTQDVPGTATIQFDAAGHITNDGTNSFTYSDRGRMTSATNAGGTVSYLYNGYGQRVYKSGPTALIPTGAAYFLYDEQGQLLGEYDSTGAPVYETVYLGSMPVGVMKQTGTAANSDIQTTVYNVHSDHIATARVITQQDQTIVWRWDTAEAFGGTVPDQNPNAAGTFVYNQRFPGQVFDSETGLFQNWNREYNARQGRYIQSDPIGLQGGINTFAYVEGNPLDDADPLGLMGNGPGKGVGAPTSSQVIRGVGNTSVCSYYDRMASQNPSCGYYKEAANICRGQGVKGYLTNSRIKMGLDAAAGSKGIIIMQGDVLNRVRASLIDADMKNRQSGNVDSNGCVCGNTVDAYHNDAFKGAGIDPRYYGGNSWPQSLWPNPVPLDPSASPFDPRRLWQ